MPGKSRETREARKERKRKLIINAALTLFSQRGFHGTTMAEVAREAGISVGSIYQYFQNKDHLYHSVLEERCNEILDAVRELLDPDRPFRENLRAVLRALHELAERNHSFFRLYLSSEHLPVLEEVRERLGTRADVIYQKFLSFFTEMMEMGMKRGELREVSPLLLAQAYLGITNTFFFEWLKGNVASLKDTEEFVITLFLSGAEKRE